MKDKVNEIFNKYECYFSGMLHSILREIIRNISEYQDCCFIQYRSSMEFDGYTLALVQKDKAGCRVLPVAFKSTNHSEISIVLDALNEEVFGIDLNESLDISTSSILKTLSN